MLPRRAVAGMDADSSLLDRSSFLSLKTAAAPCMD